MHISKLVKPSITVFALTMSAQAVAQQQQENTNAYPWAAVFLDYQHPDQPMLGLTVAVNHYDKSYPNWGYYLGYGRSKEEDLGFEAPAEGKRDLTMFRLGVSYSLSNNLSVYGGGVMFENTTEYTDGIIEFYTDPDPDPDPKPEWHTDTKRNWGGEVGLRYALTRHLVFGIGYNSVTEGGVFSIGYRG
ncbi:outer membrane beta-barrel protein [Agarivorans sp. B2Z047]|uniref:outer membrane beta-barrel protein n=1 Tax=Agarivorans sp. B2Z047 TaxID=2652721 RepID=UPI00128B16BF|nr:outer membrane beta-barrel protein [Agarivorans sp. B2Z047]MPW29481.1 outer membrane beta-barrel protein [Agarivorans sp. B2Z047]UQN45070.1 outer membrane beta-barrel protein [Agarivorans sp. B2Z047]